MIGGWYWDRTCDPYHVKVMLNFGANQPLQIYSFLALDFVRKPSIGVYGRPTNTKGGSKKRSLTNSWGFGWWESQIFWHLKQGTPP